MGETTQDVPIQFLPRLGLFLARFCIPAWIGAATLFVVVGVTEVTRGSFDSTTKDVLVSVRFPAFYACGVTLVGVGWFGVWIAGNSASFSPTRRIAALVLLMIVLITMAVDYVLIYQPLLAMVTPPGQPKPADFRRYHEASKWINLAGLTFSFVVAFLISWPPKSLNRSDRG